MSPAIIFHVPYVATLSIEEASEHATHLCLIHLGNLTSTRLEAVAPITVVLTPVASTEVVAVGQFNTPSTTELVTLLETIADTIAIFLIGRHDAVAVHHLGLRHPAREATTVVATVNDTNIVAVGEARNHIVVKLATNETGTIGTRSSYCTFVTAVLNVEFTLRTAHSTDEGSHSACTLDIARAGHGQVLNLGTYGSCIHQTYTFTVGVHLKIGNLVKLSVNLTLKAIIIRQIRTKTIERNTLHVEVVHQLHLDASIGFFL